MPEEHLDRDAIREFWKRSEDTAASLLSQGDAAARFYIGAATAAAGWFATNAGSKGLGAVLVLCLGILGAGHVAWYQLRGFRVHRRARYLAGQFADRSGVVPADRLYTTDDEVVTLLRTGQPVTGALFNGSVVLVIAVAYSLILALGSVRT